VHHPASRIAALLLLATAILAATPAYGQAEAAVLYPANGANDVCPDTPLRLTWFQTPTIQNLGKVEKGDKIVQYFSGLSVKAAPLPNFGSDPTLPGNTGTPR